MEKEKGVVEERMLEDKKGATQRTVGGWCGGGGRRGRNAGLELMPEEKNDGVEEGSGKMNKTREDGRKTGGCNERRLGEDGVTGREG